MGMKRYRRFTKDFKKKAVDLANELGSTAEASRKLGVPNPTLHKWVAASRGEADGSAEPYVAPSETPEQELARLRKEVTDLKKANKILKAAAAFFSQDHLE
jgi:transposase